MRLRCLIPALAAALALGCADATGPSSEALALEEHEAYWLAHGPASYQYVIQRLCECVPEATVPVTVVVRDGEVLARRNAITGAPVDPQFDQIFVPVPGLFALVRQAIELPAAALAVRYNGAWGFPESIQIDWVAGVVDDEFSYSVTGFSAIIE